MASYRYELVTPHEPPDETTVDALVAFLHEHLDRYGDKPEDIRRCLDYALSQQEGKGGAVLVAYEDEKDAIVGAVVFNATGMSGYIPENILVYIAVHGEHRGQGLGKALMTRALDAVEGGIALHVEPDNPARFLYEKLGFTSKYLEMRLTR
jgi:ribosomal protein S18 acetylase RimI-like enzyme